MHGAGEGCGAGPAAAGSQRRVGVVVVHGDVVALTVLDPLGLIQIGVADLARRERPVVDGDFIHATVEYRVPVTQEATQVRIRMSRRDTFESRRRGRRLPASQRLDLLGRQGAVKEGHFVEESVKGRISPRVTQTEPLASAHRAWLVKVAHLLAVQVQTHIVSVVRAGDVVPGVCLKHVVYPKVMAAAVNVHVEIKLLVPLGIVTQDRFFTVERHKAHDLIAGQRVQLDPGRHGQLLQAIRVGAINGHIVTAIELGGALVLAHPYSGRTTAACASAVVAIPGTVLELGRRPGLVQVQPHLGVF